MVNVRLGNLSHGICEFGNYELLYNCSLLHLRVVNLLFGTNKLAPCVCLTRASRRGGVCILGPKLDMVWGRVASFEVVPR